MTRETKQIGYNTTVNMSTARKLADTTPDSTFGIWIAEDNNGDEYVWLETNGNPAMLPDPDELDSSDTPVIEYWLETAGISRETLDELLADCDWWDAV